MRQVGRFAWVAGVTALLWSTTTERALGGYTPPGTGGTGAYYRVVSDSSLGYSYFSANVFLPGSSQIFVANPSKETVYVYTGGYGNVLNGSESDGQGAIDAGLQYSPAKNNWALFYRGFGSNANPARFKANQTVSMQFTVAPPANNGVGADLTISVTGLLDSNGVLLDPQRSQLVGDRPEHNQARGEHRPEQPGEPRQRYVRQRRCLVEHDARGQHCQRTLVARHRHPDRRRDVLSQRS